MSRHFRLGASEAAAAGKAPNEMMREIRQMKRRVGNPAGCFADTKDDVSISYVQRTMKFMLHQTHKSRYAEITCHVIPRGTCMSHV